VRRRLEWLSLAIMLLLAVAAGSEVRDPRSLEVLRLDCATGDYRSDLTLFGNGTLRLEEGEAGAEEMALSELDRESFDAYVRRLQVEELGDGLEPPQRVEGPWTEQCVLTLDVDDGPAGSIAFGAFDSMSLPFSRVVRIARELLALARVETRVRGLTENYSPRPGDVLLHRDGGRYRVHSVTTDGLAVELEGIEQPFTLYLAIEAISESFIAVEDR
jgi:hypothetical protein